MVFKLTGSNSRSQRKNWFGKLCTELVNLNTMNPIMREKKNSRKRGQTFFVKLRAPKLNPLKKEKKISYLIYRKEWELG